MLSVFVRVKLTINKYVSFTGYTSWIQITPNCSKLAINRINDNDDTIFWHAFVIKFLSCCRVYLVKFSYWSKFHVSIITGFRIMTIFLYKGLNRNPEIGNTSLWVLANTWRLGRVRIPNLEGICLMKCYGMLQNASVKGFGVINPIQDGGQVPPHATSFSL